MRDFRTLKVWEKAHEFTLRIYRRTAAFPADERFGLILQMRRVAATVPMAISNAAATADDADFARQFRGDPVELGNGVSVDPGPRLGVLER